MKTHLNKFLSSPFAASAVFVSFVVAWVLYGLLPDECGTDISKCPTDGSFGNLLSVLAALKNKEFGPFEALMGALAFAGLILTLIMQQRDLRLSRQQQVEQTDIFQQQSFETRFYQAIDQFRNFHSEVSTKIDPATHKLATLFKIGVLFPDTTAAAQEIRLPMTEGKGLEILNGKIRAATLAHLVLNYRSDTLHQLPDRDPMSASDFIHGKHNHLRQMKVDELKKEILKLGGDANRFRDIGVMTLWYGGTLYPLVKRVRGILKILYTQTPQQRLLYIDFLQVELKPAEMGLIALCALHESPYDGTSNKGTPSFRKLVSGCGLLNDFPQGNAKLLRAMLTQKEWETLVNACGLRVATNTPLPTT